MKTKRPMTPLEKRNKRLSEALLSVKKEILGAEDVRDPSWNEDAHVQINLTIAECRQILDALANKE